MAERHILKVDIFFSLFQPIYSAFLIKIKQLFDANFFQTHTKSGKHENKTLPWSKKEVKKMAKNGKIDPCSANHTNCNIRYFLIKFSGYIAYEMKLKFLVAIMAMIWYYQFIESLF